MNNLVILKVDDGLYKVYELWPKDNWMVQLDASPHKNQLLDKWNAEVVE